MTNGEYLRLCQKHGVGPIYLDDKAKPRKRNKATPELNKTFGEGFVLVTPTELPNTEKTKPLTESGEALNKSKRKKPKRKRPAAEKRRREHLKRVARAAERRAEHDRLASGSWATGALTTSYKRMRMVSGGLPSLGKRR